MASIPAVVGGLAVCGLLAAGAALRAGEAGQPPPPLSFANAEAESHARRHPECTCRAQGQSYPLGTQLCLQAGLFRCGMDLNVTSWQSMAMPCPLS